MNNDAMESLRKLVEGGGFESMEELNAFAQQHMNNMNHVPSADFMGLSSEQVHKFLYQPFDCPELVTIPAKLDFQPVAPIVEVLGLLLDAIGEKGLKATATGNLPRNLCREIALAHWSKEKYEFRKVYGQIMTESNVAELHITRLVCEAARVIRKQSGRFELAPAWKTPWRVHGAAALYPALLKAYAARYNWGYYDNLGECSIVQQSFLFSLYMLSRNGGKWRPLEFYEDGFIQAFPAAAQDFADIARVDPKAAAKMVYRNRMFFGFAEFFNLVSFRYTNQKPRQIDGVKKLPLLDQVVVFQRRLIKR